MSGQTYNVPARIIHSAAPRVDDDGMIKLGDTITYRGGWGDHLPTRAKVVSLDITKVQRSKYGTQVNQVSEWSVRGNWVLFGLDDGHWCYSEQVVLPGRAP